MALLNDRKGGIAMIQYSFFAILLGLLGVLIGSMFNIGLRSSGYAGMFVGLFVAYGYRQAFESHSYGLKKEIVAAIIPLLISPLLAGLVGLYYYWRG